LIYYEGHHNQLKRNNNTRIYTFSTAIIALMVQKIT
jgi:hypothetical protein